jgi:zinc/manganese transport system substrate-binding protein
MLSRALPASLLVALTAAGCGGAASTDAGGATTGSPQPGVVAIATTTMLGDVLAQVTACAGGTSQTLLPPGADPHDFAPSSEQVASLVSADLVVANGLGLEEGLEDALQTAESDGARVLEVAPELDPIEFGGPPDEQDDHANEEESDEHGSLDPHVWQDVARMATAAELIGTTLAEVSGDDAYAQCGTQVRDELLVVDDQVRETLATVPAERRVLVTDHDALGYLADAYDFEVVGTVVPGGSTLAEPSSAELAELASVITDREVPAIFANSANPSALVEAVAAETGTEVAVVELYVDSLGAEGSGADTYAGMVTTNAQRIADALGG